MGSSTRPVDFAKLEARLGRVHLAQRLGIQTDHATSRFGQGRTYFHLENARWMLLLLRVGLGCLFLYGRGQRNAAAIRIRRNEVRLRHLPLPFEGYTILQLSDLHLDSNPAICEALIQRLAEVEYDLCVITGDFRFRTSGSYDLCMERMARVRPHLRSPVYGVLGNHDFVEMVTDLEAMDLRILLNESVVLQQGGAALYLAGVDDTHFYLADNLDKALAQVPAGAATVLLSHSPELYREAAYCHVDLMLSGHTHGGQVCLPGQRALTFNARCPRRVCAGPWVYRQLAGYTSVGTGSSGLDVRFNCPPEIVLHRLRRG